LSGARFLAALTLKVAGLAQAALLSSTASARRRHGGEMEVRLGEALRLDRAAIALLGMAALDPAIGQAELSGDSDVVILALRDMQDVVRVSPSASDEGEDLLERRPDPAFPCRCRLR
jgi:hypothetical protein